MAGATGLLSADRTTFRPGHVLAAVASNHQRKCESALPQLLAIKNDIFSKILMTRLLKLNNKVVCIFCFECIGSESQLHTIDKPILVHFPAYLGSLKSWNQTVLFLKSTFTESQLCCCIINM